MAFYSNKIISIEDKFVLHCHGKKSINIKFLWFIQFQCFKWIYFGHMQVFAQNSKFEIAQQLQQFHFHLHLHRFQSCVLSILNIFNQFNFLRNNFEIVLMQCKQHRSHSISFKYQEQEVPKCNIHFWSIVLVLKQETFSIHILFVP